MSWSGGCQCGAVRYRVEGDLGRASICHCRMCQKAFGSFFGAFVSVKAEQVTWTRGEPKRFQSSNKVARGFCGDCGTPLTFDWSREVYDLTIGSFDRAAEIPPVAQLAVEARLPYVAGLTALPHKSPAMNPALAAYLADIVSRQHPDHDTETWPPTS